MTTGRCAACSDIAQCTVCGERVEGFRHIGVRGTGLMSSSIWHYAVPCGHRNEPEKARPSPDQQKAGLAVFNGGPVWKDGYQWINIFWGSYWNTSPWVARLNTAVEDIEVNKSYSGELIQYNVGTGKLGGYHIISQDPPGSVSEKAIGEAISGWVTAGTIQDVGIKGAYNVFLPPGVSATLGTDSSCVQFCDYHDTANGKSGPFFTCEPYPCGSGCNQCNSNDFDTLTQGLSEEMVELKTDMDPGTGWVIGNEEVCDYCDKNFICNKISTGQYVNAWYSNAQGKCWSP